MAFLEYRPTHPLYQYTSMGGFLGIIGSKRLRFSDLAKANDPREIKLGYERLMRALDGVLADGNLAGRGRLAQLRERLVGYHENTRFYSCCFSTERDALPMWHAYSGGYAGVVVGFRPTAILGLPARLQKVRYVDESTDVVFKSLALEMAAQLAAGYPRDVLSWITAATDGITAVTALKHQSWSYEREIRAIHVQRKERPQGYLANLPIAAVGKAELFWQEPSERMVDDRIVKYLDFPFGPWRGGTFDHRQAIESVTLGPKCAMNEPEIRESLVTHGFEKFTIRKSQCDIR